MYHDGTFKVDLPIHEWNQIHVSIDIPVQWILWVLLAFVSRVVVHIGRLLPSFAFHIEGYTYIINIGEFAGMMFFVDHRLLMMFPVIKEGKKELKWCYCWFQSKLFPTGHSRCTNLCILNKKGPCHSQFLHLHLLSVAGIDPKILML